MKNKSTAMVEMRTIIADDHPLFRNGLRQFLSLCEKPLFNIIAEAADGEQALADCKKHQPDLLIMDMNMPKIDGLGLLDALAQECRVAHKLVLSEYSHPKIVRAALSAGADAYVLKSEPPEVLCLAITQLLKGESYLSEPVQLNRALKRRGRLQKKDNYASRDAFLKKYSLTRREMEILHLITQAMSNKEIGKALFISDQTVSVHRKNIMRKLGVSNTAGLVKTAYDYALV